MIDASEVFGELKPFNTQKILKEYQIPFSLIKDYKDLAHYDLIVIGNNSIDMDEVQSNAPAIRQYVENGGRLLVFDQTFAGRIPFLDELTYSLAGPGQFTEILRFNHPMVKDMAQNDFFCWNQEDWCIYRTYITPVSEAAVTTGGDTTQWGADHFGMVNAHLKLGKGDIMFTQAEVTKAFQNDAAAAKLTRNILTTMLDDKTRENASPFKGHSKANVKAISDSKAVCISLAEAANRGFADNATNGKKGGWTGQGPKNDLASFPVGTQRFAGTMFKIVDPDKNNGNGCVVVSDNKALPFKPQSAPIKVDQKLNRIVFLHIGAWISGKDVGEYIVNFKSGQSATIPISTKVNIADWWNAPTQSLSAADCAWSAFNGSSVVGAIAFEWKNPRADYDAIDTIVVKSNGDAVVGLLGITGEKN